MRSVRCLTALLVLAAVAPAAAEAGTAPGRNGPVAFATFAGCPGEYPCRDIQPRVRLVGPDGRGSRILLRCPFGCATRVHGLAWAPDGRSLAMVAGDGDKSHVGILDVRTRRLTRVPGLVAPYGIDWSPRGDRLLFAAGRDLHTVRPDGRGRVRLTRGQMAGQATWSARGHIAFIDGRDLLPDDGWLSHGNIRVFDPRTRRVRVVARGAGSVGVWLHGWSPGGRLWLSDGYDGDVSMRPDGRGRRRAAWPVGAVSFSPDGRRLAVAERGSVWSRTLGRERERRLFRYKDDIVTSVSWARR